MRRTLPVVLHLVAVIPGWFWHPLRSGNGYNSWSGWISDVAEITVVGAIAASLAAWWRKHNCHVHRCWRLQWHEHPEHGHPVCAVHHPNGHHGTWWRLFHWKFHSDDHFLAAHRHKYEHSGQLSPFEQPPTGTAMTWAVTSAAPTAAGQVLDTVTPEKQRPERERKPGVPLVTDLDSKRG